MLIPAIFYGKPGRVMSRMRKLARGLTEAGQYSEYDPGPFLDTSNVDGLVLVRDDPVPGEHFHCYALSDALLHEAPEAEAGMVVASWLQTSLDPLWKFVGTLAECSRAGLSKGDVLAAQQYAEAAVRHWPAMEAERDRFQDIHGRDILRNWTTLFVALEILGLPSIERVAMGGEPQDWLARVIERSGTE